MKRYTLDYSIAMLILIVSVLSIIGCTQKMTPMGISSTGDLALPDKISDVIRLITTASSPHRERLTLHGAKLYLQKGELERCQLLLDTLLPRELPSTLKAEYLIILSKKAIRNQQNEVALQSLTTNQFGLFDIIHELDTNTQIAISEARADAYEASGNYLAAARERIFFGPLLLEEDGFSSTDSNDIDITSPETPPARLLMQNNRIQINNEAIWGNLMAVPKIQLSELAVTALGDDYRGWLELAYLNKAYQDDLDLQVHELNQWIARHPSHIATTHLPGFLKAVQLATHSRPQRIALLLPSSGKFKGAARSIQDGFLSAHYSAQNNRQHKNPLHNSIQGRTTLSVYDTSSYENIKQVYNHAIQDGAEMIIGPLKKNNVALLKQQAELSVPVLALNYAGDEKPASPHFFQFGLRTEDEVKQVAKQAWTNGHKQAAVLFPESEWGYRIQQAFVDHWLGFGGNVVTQSSFTGKNDFSDAIKSMLNIEQSEQRAKDIKNLLGESIEFNPRRRQDIDFIFLLSSPRQARQIKPTLDFHYATDLPVFATSNIYEGYTDPDRDKDINGIQFVDIPWVLTDEDAVKAGSQVLWHQSRNANNRPSQRLHALGVDAYRLIPRLQIMLAVPNGSLFGATGTLTLADNQRIERTLMWAQIKHGVPELLPITLDTTTKPILPNQHNTLNRHDIDIPHSGDAEHETDTPARLPEPITP